MVKCSDITEYFEEIAPNELAEDWDNIGLLVGSKTDSVNRIMLCLDVTSASIQEAIDRKADLIITHHPVIFRAIKKVVEGEGVGSLLLGLIKNGINLFTAHTNLDFADGGVNARLAELIGLKDLTVLGDGPGKVGRLEAEMTLEEFAHLVMKGLSAPDVKMIGKAESRVVKAAVFSGSFDENLEDVLKSGTNVLVTGDIKHHTALDAIEAGLCIIDAGHFYTERVILPVLQETLKKKFPQLEVLYFEDEKAPFTTINERES